MTDDAESRSDKRADTERAAGGPDPADPDRSAATAEDATGDFGDDAPSFGDLTLPQRVFVAAVQNPTRGVVIAGLLAFGFSFYVAFWLAFPRVAAFMSAVGAVLVAIVALVYLISDRVSG
ncbi:hypothetical protein DJ82_02000 [Halorubrum sp. Ib24]|uniref:hypothetical protein n=1 Tax=unclassified Halorubrum TaxID=2642239 RepID=UPI000B97FC28|nr:MULTISPECIES: hypothetical protein [unclassified Halorubrum]OYR39297.1 hypothetical protein DJ75_16810 [Halorubrum sp. Eb13]OYR42805.1 hypothetical protein DJ82_02000 [Halorubrum sp. Ib24]OYR44457.1 hypothetical protein DJ81_07165 [Halorubrum sp. Hd13]OYR46096.1 hypothetical protein DJ74_15290 [Halorubrum sp. Ea8]OYR55310.1 hypothetical protein DJ73_02485 [Halorubrum sp. Ea1]